MHKSISTPVSPYGLSQLRGRIRQFVILSQGLATSASSCPYPTIRPSTEKVHSSLVSKKPPLDLPVFGSAHQLQSSHVESTSNVILQQGCHPSLPPVNACIPKPHVSHPTKIFSESRAADSSPLSPASFLHQPPSLSLCETSDEPPLANPKTTTPPPCCKNPTKRLLGPPPTLLVQTFPSGVTPAISPNNLQTRRILYK